LSKTFKDKQVAREAGAKGGRVKNPNKGFGSGTAKAAVQRRWEIYRQRKAAEAVEDLEKGLDKYVKDYEDLESRP
jgi:hypothetical protein